MKTMFAPWRMKFITSKKEKGCIFCRTLKSKEDKKNLVLYRSKTAFVILNLYPYTNGHLMIVPKKHTNKIENLNSSELCELMKLVQLSVKALDKTYKPQGYNIGMNIGKCGGAGIAGHIHIHVVPRWLGDTNFTSAICETKVIPESLAETYKKLKKVIEVPHV
ncbi:MAG: HIT domain-containing protein [Elusimicrobia bacterium]|nr:HIT domain-containing protein [Elusimicrobiota bacterium]MBU2614240.1 HIT domain-containing protein [Elusimicrobiota bacterium]